MTEVLASPSAQPYTARLAGAGALLDELEAVLHAAPVEASRDDFRRLILDENAARKSTANARMWAWKRLKLRYLLDSPDLPEFEAFRMDAAAGRAAGCRTIMVGPDAATASELPREIRPDHAVRDLDAAARIVVGGASEGRAEGSLGGSARAPIGVG
jgi:hypothetical protein